MFGSVAVPCFAKSAPGTRQCKLGDLSMTVDRRENWLPQSLISGDVHTYGEGGDQFPAWGPRYLERGQGAYVWDDLGNRFLDWTMGLRTVTLAMGVPRSMTRATNNCARAANLNARRSSKRNWRKNSSI